MNKILTCGQSAVIHGTPTDLRINYQSLFTAQLQHVECTSDSYCEANKEAALEEVLKPLRQTGPALAVQTTAGSSSV